MPSPTPRQISRRANRILQWLAFSVAVTVIAVGLTASPAAQASPVEVSATAPVEPGILRIDTNLPIQSAVGQGTGVVLSPDGIALTNNHVISGATDITATNVGTGASFAVDVLGYDRKTDIAVLQLRGASNLPVAPTADSASVRVGDPIIGVGFPGGGPLTSSPGVVRSLNQNITASDDLTGSSETLSGLIGFDADTRAGDSGGPLVNNAGQVIGIITVGSESYKMESTGGFAIPIDQALSTANAIRSGTQSGTVHVGPTGILGIGINDSAGDQSGVVVQGVLRDGPAERAGLTGGDVITAVDSTPTPDGTALVDVLDQHHPGDTVTVSYLDADRTARSVPVMLTPGPAN